MDFTHTTRLSRRHPLTPHYDLFVTLIPQNVDVWGWVKYFEEGGGESNKKANHGDGRRRHSGTRQQHKPQRPLPEIKGLASDGGDGEGSSLASTTRRTTTTRRDEKGAISASAASEDGGKRSRLFEDKTLLAPGPVLGGLEGDGRGIREALRMEAKDNSVAVGIQVENWQV